MAKFIIAYQGGKDPETKEQGMANMQRWKQWLEAMGSIVVDPGTPLMHAHFVTSGGVVKAEKGSTINGITVIEVETLEEALEHAKACPFLDTEGTLVVAQMMMMKP